MFQRFLIIIFLIFCAEASASPLIMHVPNIPDYSFGREDVVDNIRQHLKKDRAFLALVGLTGIGKTHVMKRYIQKYKNDYHIIWWFHAQQDIAEQYQSFARFINTFYGENILINIQDPVTTLDYIKNYLATTELSWLLVFDDVANKKDILDLLPPQGFKKHVLVSSQEVIGWPHAMEIKAFDKHASLEFLLTHLSNEPQEDLVQLAETLRQYPLALSQAIHYLSSTPSTSAAEYIKEFKKNRRRLWAKEEFVQSANIFSRHNSVSTAIDLTLQKVQDESPDMLQFLEIASLFDGNLIPADVMRKALDLDTKSYDYLVMKARQYALIEMQKSIPGQLDYLYMHDMVRYVLQDRISVKKTKKLLAKIVQGYNDVIPLELDRNLLAEFAVLNPGLFSQALQFSGKVELSSDTNVDIIELYIKLLLYYLPSKHDYQIAEKLLHDVAILRSYTYLSNGIMIDMLYASLAAGFHFWKHNDARKAISMLKKIAVPIGLEQTHPDVVLFIYNRFMQMYAHVGDLQGANYYRMRAEPLVEKSMYASNKEWFHAEKASILFNQGQYAEALLSINTAWSLITYKNPYEDYCAANVHIIKSRLLIRMGRYKEAYDLLENLRQGIKNLEVVDSGISSIFSGNILGGLAYIKYKQGGSQQEFRSLEHAVLGMKKHMEGVVSAYSRSYVESLLYLGDAYMMSKAYDDAREIFFHIEALLDKSQVDKNLETYSLIFNELIHIGVHLNDDELVRTYVKRSKERFGLKHPRTQEVIKHVIREKGAVFL